MPQDTTEIDVTRPQEEVGDPFNDSAHRGLIAPLQLAITPQRLSLGIVGEEIGKRAEVELAQSQAEKHKKRRASAIDEKESGRKPWAENSHPFRLKTKQQ